MPELPVRPSVVPPRRIASLLDRLHAAGLSGIRLVGDPAVEITGITHDSRLVLPGDLYVARRGEHTHGIAHVGEAIAAGAAAVLTDGVVAQEAVDSGVAAVLVVDEPRDAMGPAAAWTYGEPAETMTLLGVTGTNGKTTTSYLIEAGLRAAGRRTGLVGTIETRIDGETVPSARTTPEATELHALLAVMRERGVDAVVMEVSSHALVLGRVDGVVFDVAGFTNLSQDHLDFHGDMAGYFAAKASLFAPSRARRGVINVDDEWGVRLSGEAIVPLVTTGRRSDATWRRVDETPATAASEGIVRLIGPDDASVDVGCALLGTVNLVNAVTAFVMLVEAGIEVGVARDGVASLLAVPGRLERVDAGQQFLALVDYAHTPGAVTAVLADARDLAGPGGRVLVVLGCGGDRDREKRPMMGAAAAAGADLAVFTNDNPRSEDPDEILAAMQRGVPTGLRVLVEPDRARAIDAAVGLARPGDVLVIAGKGHEQGQEAAGVVVPFDDRVVLRAALISHLGAA
jgi:UDP-N-acetylmuramoyl-L-alanyl-D-glutamate--2,6-diaminopimelate ligase